MGNWGQSTDVSPEPAYINATLATHAQKTEQTESVLVFSSRHLLSFPFLPPWPTTRATKLGAGLILETEETPALRNNRTERYVAYAARTARRDELF